MAEPRCEACGRTIRYAYVALAVNGRLRYWCGWPASCAGQIKHVDE